MSIAGTPKLPREEVVQVVNSSTKKIISHFHIFELIVNLYLRTLYQKRKKMCNLSVLLASPVPTLILWETDTWKEGKKS